MANELTVVVGASTAARPVRGVSPSTEVPFNWQDERTWGPAIVRASALYLTYHPDLALPEAADQVGALSRLAVHESVSKNVKRVLGRSARSFQAYARSAAEVLR